MSQSSSSSSDSDSSIEFDPISLTSISQTNNNLTTSNDHTDPSQVQASTLPTTQPILDNQSDSSDPDPNNPSNQPVPTLANLIRDLPPVPAANATPKTPNVFGSSSEDDDDDDDDDMDEVEAPVLNLSIDPQSLPTSNQNPPTAATRSWMSQRKGKAILIDGVDHSNTMMEEDSNEENSSNGQIGSAQRIRELGLVDEQIAALLGMASKALECLSPPPPSAKLEDSKSIQTFSESIQEYFTTLNNVQLGLRTSIVHLRAARISTRILFEPPHSNVPETSNKSRLMRYKKLIHKTLTSDREYIDPEVKPANPG
ncbi:uncharacterized protein MELLADRAFT_124662, partial [Melampsora larici-populina 98AG31]